MAKNRPILVAYLSMQVIFIQKKPPIRWGGLKVDITD